MDRRAGARAREQMMKKDPAILILKENNQMCMHAHTPTKTQIDSRAGARAREQMMKKDPAI